MFQGTMVAKPYAEGLDVATAIKNINSSRVGNLFSLIQLDFYNGRTLPSANSFW